MYLFIKEPVSDDDDDKRLTHFKTRAAKGLARVINVISYEYAVEYSIVYILEILWKYCYRIFYGIFSIITKTKTGFAAT